MGWWRDERYMVTLNRLVSRDVIEYVDTGGPEVGMRFTEEFTTHMFEETARLLLRPSRGGNLLEALDEMDEDEFMFYWGTMMYLSYIKPEMERMDHLLSIVQFIVAFDTGQHHGRTLYSHMKKP